MKGISKRDFFVSFFASLFFNLFKRMLTSISHLSSRAVCRTLLLLLLISSVYGADYNQASGIGSWLTQVWDKPNGMTIKINCTSSNARIVVNFTKPNQDGATRALIFANGSLTNHYIASAYFVGDVATFNDSVILDCGAEYQFMTDKNGASRTATYKDASTPRYLDRSTWIIQSQCTTTACTAISNNSGYYEGMDTFTLRDYFEASPNLDSIRATIDKNITSISSIWMNWSTIGNYSYSEFYRGTTLCYNGTNKYGNCTGLTNGTQYLMNVSVYWNSTLHNHTTSYITTDQTAQIYPNLDSLRIENITNITGLSSIYVDWSIVGNYSYSEAFLNDVIQFNGSSTEYNFTSLTNGTQYDIDLIVYLNSTLFNTSDLLISTLQTIQSVTPTGDYTDQLDTIIEGINMIAWFLLYLGLLALGYWMLTHGNFIVGTPMILMTIFLDAYFLTLYSDISVLKWMFIIAIVVKVFGWNKLRSLAFRR